MAVATSSMHLSSTQLPISNSISVASSSSPSCASSSTPIRAVVRSIKKQQRNAPHVSHNENISESGANSGALARARAWRASHAGDAVGSSQEWLSREVRRVEMFDNVHGTAIVVRALSDDQPAPAHLSRVKSRKSVPMVKIGSRVGGAL